MNLKSALLPVSGALLFCVTGCGQTVLQRDQATFPQAVKLYQNGCITCHGDNLQGGIGPNLQHVGSRLSLADIKHRIEVGGGPMPPYAAPGNPILTPDQIQTLSVWLAAQK